MSSIALMVHSAQPAAGGGDVLVISHGTEHGLYVEVSRKRVLLHAAALRVIRAGLEGRLDDAEVTQRLLLDKVKSWTQLKGSSKECRI